MKAVRTISTFLFFLSFVTLLSSQEINIIDSETREALPFVNIQSGSYRNITDVEGKIAFDNWDGNKFFIFSLLGYEDARYTIAEIISSEYMVALLVTDKLLEEVTISTNRWAQNKKEVAIKVSSISQKTLSVDNPQTSADLLKSSGHVYIQKSQLGGGSPIIRGFSTSRILLVVDGIRMNNAIFRSGNLQNVLSIDPLAIGSTEVSYGPGSVMYGSDAIGGVMNFFTLDPRFSSTDKLRKSGRLFTRYSSANFEKTAHVDYSLGGKKWASISSFSFTDFNDLKMGSNGPDDYLNQFYVKRENGLDVKISNKDPRVQRPTGFSQFSAMQKFKVRPSENSFLTYGFYFSQLSEVPRFDRLVRERNGNPRYGEWEYGPQKWLFQHINYKTLQPSAYYDNASFTLGHQSYMESRITRDYNALERNVRTENLKIFSTNLDFKKSLSEVDLFYGAEWVVNDVSSNGRSEFLNGNPDEVISARYPESTWSSLGVYTTAQYKISEKYMWQAGLRWNGYGISADFTNSRLTLPFDKVDLKFSNFTGNIGMVYNYNINGQVSTNFSTGMRAPNVDDVGKVFDSAPGIIIIPNPDLSSEIAYNAEANLIHVFGRAVSIDASVYYTYLDNAMVRRDFSLNGTDSLFYDGQLSQIQAIQNAANAYVAGIQLGLKYNLSKKLTLNANYNYQKGTEETDDGTRTRSRHIVPTFGNIKFTYKAARFQWYNQIEFQGQIGFNDLPVTEKDKPFLYAKDDAGNPFAPSWWIWNSKVKWDVNPQFYLAGGVENVLDKRYRAYSSGISAPGRNFILALSFKI